MQTPGAPPIPHVGGPLMPPGGIKYISGVLPVAIVGGQAICVGSPDSIMQGSAKVMVGVMPAARITSSTAHGGKVITSAGLMTVTG